MGMGELSKIVMGDPIALEPREQTSDDIHNLLERAILRLNSSRFTYKRHILLIGRDLTASALRPSHPMETS